MLSPVRLLRQAILATKREGRLRERERWCRRGRITHKKVIAEFVRFKNNMQKGFLGSYSSV
jgi:hypothetical protein